MPEKYFGHVLKRIFDLEDCKTLTDSGSFSSYLRISFCVLCCRKSKKDPAQLLYFVDLASRRISG
jgi:hypothetical protein